MKSAWRCAPNWKSSDGDGIHPRRGARRPTAGFGLRHGAPVGPEARRQEGSGGHRPAEAGGQAVRGPVPADDAQAHARGHAQGRPVRFPADADAAVDGRRAAGAAPGHAGHRAVEGHPGPDARKANRATCPRTPSQIGQGGDLDFRTGGSREDVGAAERDAQQPPQRSGWRPEGAPEHVVDFVSKMARAANLASQESGVPARLIMGQAALESGWGKREIMHADGTTSHNLFGIKAGASWKARSSTCSRPNTRMAWRKR